jgi:hypothetical protein
MTKATPTAKTASTKKRAKPKKPSAPTPKPEGYVFGRPTKYRPEYCEQIVEYFQRPAYREVTLPNGQTQNVCNVFPTMTRFADSIGVDDSTLEDWILVHPNFLRAYKTAKKLQEAILQEGALGGAYHGSFAIFTAKNVCGWRDEKDLNLANKPGEKFQTDSTVTLSTLSDVIAKAKAKR